MNCARCGAVIPEGSSACPSCGLQLKLTHPEGAQRFPPPSQQGVPPSQPAFPPQQGQPPVQPVSDATPPPLGFQQQTVYAPGEVQPPSMQAGRKHGVPGALIAFIAILLIAAIGAGVYFLVFRKSSTKTGPEGTVQKYFEAVSAGDMNTLESLFTPKDKIPVEQLKMLTSMVSSTDLKFDEIKTKLVKETATDAEVSIEEITISAQGQKAKLDPKLINQQATVKLKKVGDNWLIDATTVFQTPINPVTPGVSGTPL